MRAKADGMLPEAERRGYNNVFAAFSAIIKNEVKLITKILSFFLKK